MSHATVAVPDLAVVHGQMADYGGLLYESAYLLTAVAEAAPTSRAEEFDVLMGVESESLDKYQQLIHRISVPGDSAAATDWEAEQRLVSSVHALFEVIVRIGANLAGSSVPDLPADVIHNVRLVESVSRSLARALELDQDPAEVERCLWAVQLGVQAIDRQIAGLTSDRTGAVPHQSSVRPDFD